MSGITFSYVPGKCLICQVKPASINLFCEDCAPKSNKTVTIDEQTALLRRITNQTILIKDMKPGETGYTEANSIFEIENCLFIVGSNYVSPEKNGQKTAKITMEEGYVVIHRQTVDDDGILPELPDDLEEGVQIFQAVISD